MDAIFIGIYLIFGFLVLILLTAGSQLSNNRRRTSGCSQFIVITLWPIFLFALFMVALAYFLDMFVSLFRK